MSLCIKGVAQQGYFSPRDFGEMTVSVEFYVLGDNPIEEVRRLHELVGRNSAVVILAEGEEMPCATDHSEEWPGITDV